ncbi:glycosyltransferase family 9 protein [bacterium]|nr:glycosyltransferase family 9 protein [bacterium]
MNIAVISLGFLGDTLLVEALCKNIRKKFPDSKIIFIVNKVFEEVPLGFDCVDEIYSFDKKGKHKGFGGYFRFAKGFPYRGKIDYCIITHEHERSIITAKLIGAKKIISKPVKNSPLNLLINMRRPISQKEIENTYKADYFSDFLKPLVEPEHMPVHYERKDIDDRAVLKKYKLPESYIVLSPTSKDLVKDWDFDNVKCFIDNSPLPVVLVGTDKALMLGGKLAEYGSDFINITNRTSITELGVIIKHAEVCVSMDTGTFHFSYAQGTKTVGIFFNSYFVKMWAPVNCDNVELLVGNKKIEKNGIRCVKDVTYNDVLDSVNKILKKPCLESVLK